MKGCLRTRLVVCATTEVEDVKPLALAEPYALPIEDNEPERGDLDDIPYGMEKVLEPAESESLEELLPDDDLGDNWVNCPTKNSTSGLRIGSAEFQNISVRP